MADSDFLDMLAKNPELRSAMQKIVSLLPAASGSSASTSSASSGSGGSSASASSSSGSSSSSSSDNKRAGAEDDRLDNPEGSDQKNGGGLRVEIDGDSKKVQGDAQGEDNKNKEEGEEEDDEEEEKEEKAKAKVSRERSRSARSREKRSERSRSPRSKSKSRERQRRKSRSRSHNRSRSRGSHRIVRKRDQPNRRTITLVYCRACVRACDSLEHDLCFHMHFFFWHRAYSHSGKFRSLELMQEMRDALRAAGYEHGAITDKFVTDLVQSQMEFVEEDRRQFTSHREVEAAKREFLLPAECRGQTGAQRWLTKAVVKAIYIHEKT